MYCVYIFSFSHLIPFLSLEIIEDKIFLYSFSLLWYRRAKCRRIVSRNLSVFATLTRFHFTSFLNVIHKFSVVILNFLVFSTAYIILLRRYNESLASSDLKFMMEKEWNASLLMVHASVHFFKWRQNISFRYILVIRRKINHTRRKINSWKHPNLRGIFSVSLSL